MNLLDNYQNENEYYDENDLGYSQEDERMYDEVIDHRNINFTSN